ncbi:MAG TPA: hypothetical protein VGC74_06725 [Stenotrophomonas sp.]
MLATTPAPAPDCLERLLEELGWTIARDEVATPRIDGGEPCKRASLAEARSHGDLRLVLPRQSSADEVAKTLQSLLDDPATRCAYAFRLGDAARRAAQRLQDNPGFRFTRVQLGWIGFGWGGAQAQGWQPVRAWGRGFQPADGNARALQAFYSGQVRAECGVGRQVAQLATQRELYGDVGFDAAFSPGELSIGTFNALHDTDSILLGRHAGERFADGKAKRTSAMGRQAFMGVPGFIEHAYSQWYLDDISNRAENFIVVDVDEAAAQALAEHGGLSYYDEINHRLWALSRQLPGGGKRYFERLLQEHDPRLRARLDPHARQVVAMMDHLLADPFYQGFVVYVHPLGIRPIGFHIARLLDRNPRTPFTVDLALHNLHDELYHRWIDYRLRTCAGPMDTLAAATVR